MIQTRNTDLVNLREILRVHPHILLPALTKLLVILDTQAPVHYLNIWFAVRKNTGYVPNGRNLSQLCHAFLQYGVLFFAQIRKRTTFNWVSSGGPIGVGTLQGSYKKRLRDALQGRRVSIPYTTLILHKIEKKFIHALFIH